MRSNGVEFNGSGRVSTFAFFASEADTDTSSAAWSRGVVESWSRGVLAGSSLADHHPPHHEG
jgi:hypothetical protein